MFISDEAARNDEREKTNALSERIIGLAFKVANTLNQGFSEKVYENALTYELKKAGIDVLQQVGLDVYYEGAVIGHYIADLLIERRIIVELKVAKSIEEAHIAQCRNYLMVTRLNLALVINFGGTKVEVRRVVNRF